MAKVTFTGILPPGVSGKDVIVALAGIFNQDEVLNHAIEFTGSEQTMRSLPIHARLTIANMTTEWGALTGEQAFMNKIFEGLTRLIPIIRTFPG